MEGSEAKTASASATMARPAKTIAMLDVARFAFGIVFIVLGAGLLLEGAVGGRLFLDGVNRVFEFYVGLMSVVLGALLIAGMSKRSRGT